MSSRRGFDAGPQTHHSSAISTPPNELETLLDMARTLRRWQVSEVMTFCLENATAYEANARQIAARVLCRKPGPITSMDVAVLFCVSDVLHNSRYAYRCRGAGGYRQAFQDVLPSVFARLYDAANGSQDTNGMVAELSLGAMQIKQVLLAWREWEVFPLIFQQGLEAVFLGGAMASTIAKGDSDTEDDPVVQSFMQHHAVMDDISLARHCRSRALVEGSSKATAPLRSILFQRLRNFERYWVHLQQGGTDLNSAVSSRSVVGSLLAVSHSQSNVVDDIDGVLVQAPPQIAEEDIDGVPIDAPSGTHRVGKIPADAFDEDLVREPAVALEFQRWRISAAKTFADNTASDEDPQARKALKAAKVKCTGVQWTSRERGTSPVVEAASITLERAKQADAAATALERAKQIEDEAFRGTRERQQAVDGAGKDAARAEKAERKDRRRHRKTTGTTGVQWISRERGTSPEAEAAVIALDRAKQIEGEPLSAMRDGQAAVDVAGKEAAVMTEKPKKRVRRRPRGEIDVVGAAASEDKTLQRERTHRSRTRRSSTAAAAVSSGANAESAKRRRHRSRSRRRRRRETPTLGDPPSLEAVDSSAATGIHSEPAEVASAASAAVAASAAASAAAFLEARSRAPAAPLVLAPAPVVPTPAPVRPKDRGRRRHKRRKRPRSFEPDPSLDGESLDTSDEEYLDREVSEQDHIEKVRRRILKRLLQGGLQVNGDQLALLS